MTSLLDGIEAEVTYDHDHYGNCMQHFCAH